MCGLVGVAGLNLIKMDSEVFYNLLHLDQFRGEHSTGVGLIKNDGSTEVFKEVGPPQFLYIKHKDFLTNGRFPHQNVAVLMGHNRHATQGEINVDNAHPFDMGNIIGAHNGTVNLFNMKELNGYDLHKMDSKIIFQHINDTNNVQEVWDEAGAGAMALVWYNKEEKSLNVARNNDRPLHYVIINNIIYWASEPWMLLIGLSKANIKIKEVFSFEPNIHYKFTKQNHKLEVVKNVLNPFSFSKGGWGGAKGAETYNDDYKFCSFHLKEFISILPTKSNKITTGYFIGETLYGEEVRITICNDNTDEIVKDFNSKTEEERESIFYCTRRARWNYNKRKKEMILHCFWTDVMTVDDYFSNRKLEDLKPKKERYHSDYAPTIPGWTAHKETWLKNVENGCDNCQRAIIWDDRFDVKWLDKTTVVCKDCKNLPIVTSVKPS